MIDFQNLEVWQHSRQLANSIYTISRAFPKQEMFGLTSQIQRSAVSVPSNIAEGIGRRTKNEIIHFLHIARGSLFELETQLIIACDQDYVTQQAYQKIDKEIVSCKKLINGFIRYQEKTKH